MTTAITRTGVRLVGVLNLTPDSFSDGGRFPTLAHALRHARELRAAGADIIDVGGESTRPGAVPVDPRVEQDRILGAIEALAADGMTVSVDTMHAETAVRAVEAGAAIVNDVSGGLVDPDLLAAVAGLDCQIVLGHLRGTAATMQEFACYGDPAQEVAAELYERALAAHAVGIASDRVVLDPGIGFAKNADDNWDVLARLPILAEFGYPIMVGVSRKRFLAEVLPAGAAVVERDLPTSVFTALLIRSGVNAIRVHDVAGSRAALELVARLDRHGCLDRDRETALSWATSAFAAPATARAH
ncbi:dihydropteroate synthase [Nocardia sp. R6R-6]|uniref:dihydropteroate synthase n=1 Tax=Nocardia sp. R6R-6 TaxID=3459303 RepID=UPI00403D6B6F